MRRAVLVFHPIVGTDKGQWLKSGTTLLDDRDLSISVGFQEFVRRIEKKGKRVKVVKIPTLRTLEKYSFDGIAKTPDGCKVEPDGICPHGFHSWLVYTDLI